MKQLCSALLSFFVATQLIAAQTKPNSTTTTPGDTMVANYFRAETIRLAENSLSNIQTLDDWNKRKTEYRRQLSEMLGLWPMPEKTPLKPIVTGKLEHPDFIVENLQFQSSPGLYITANVYIPRNTTKPVPAILYLSGHAQVSSNGVSYGNKTGYQRYGPWFAQNGYVCLILDTIQLGEIRGSHHGTYREGRWWWNSRGYTPAGVEAWNAIRALDYLESRPEVDATRIGATGRSGGGAHSWYIAALDDRIKVSVPIAGITDLENHIIDGCVERHCDCMFMLNTYQWDYPLLAALTAPRPLLFGNTDKDKIFPLNGIIRVHSKIHKIYELHNATNNLGLLITEGPHKDTQELQIAAFRWFNRFLKNEDPIIEMAATNLFQPHELKVFAKIPKDERTSKIHETFVPTFSPVPPPDSKSQWEQQRDTWKQFLKEKVFVAWPDKVATPELRRVSESEKHGSQLVEYEFTSQEQVTLPVFVLQKPDAKQLVVRVLDQNDWIAFSKNFSSKNFEGLDLDENSSVAFIAPRGIGPTAWTTNSVKATHIRRRFMLLGTTVDAMRVWDIQKAIEALRNHRDYRHLPITLRGEREMGVNALYASLFSSALKGIELKEIPSSHRTAPDYFNILKAMDIPHAVAMSAENTSVKLQGVDPADWKFPVSAARNLGWKTVKISP